MGSSTKDKPQQVEFYRKLGVNLREARKRAKLSQDEVANLVGLKRTSLTNIEGGRQHPPLHVLCEIVERLNVSVSDVLPTEQVQTQDPAIQEMLGKQLRDAGEMAFVKSAIGLKESGENDGHSEAED